MFCNHCGTQAPEGAQFCNACGARLNTEAGAYKAPKKKKESGAPREKKRSVLPVLLVVLLTLAAGAYFLFFAPQTVWLTVESELQNDGSEQCDSYEYDENGRILSYCKTIDYPYNDTELETEFDYIYDEKGVLIAAEVSAYDADWEIEYIYDQKGVLQELVGEARGSDYEMEASCDADGRIETVEFFDEDGNTSGEIAFSYHENGKVREIIRNIPGADATIEVHYDENGNLTEQQTYVDGDLVAETLQEFTEEGYMTMMETYDPYSGNSTVIEFEPQYDKDDNLIGLIICAEAEGESFEIEFSAQYDDDTLILELEDLPEELEDMVDDAEIEVIFDEDGAVLGFSILVDDEVYSESSRERESFRIPRKQRRFSLNDPYWLTGIFG